MSTAKKPKNNPEHNCWRSDFELVARHVRELAEDARKRHLDGGFSAGEQYYAYMRVYYFMAGVADANGMTLPEIAQ